MPGGQIHRALPFISVAHVEFGAHGILEHGFVMSQNVPVKPAVHVHVYDVPPVRIHVPPLRHGGMAPDVITHGSTISQKRPERPVGHTQRNVELANTTQVPCIQVTVAHGFEYFSQKTPEENDLVEDTIEYMLNCTYLLLKIAGQTYR